MSNEKFEHVTLVSKANLYFDGKIVSHTFYMPSGERKTAGLFMPGEYPQIGTADAELMEITDGTCDFKLAGEAAWKTVKAGESFKVPGKSEFALKTAGILQYICSYFPER